jgi:hypothetical protein
MSKRLVYTRPEDGGVSIVHIAPDTRMLLPRKGFPPVLEPEPYWLQRMAAQVIPANAQDVHVIDVADVPADRSYRNAWKHQAGIISVHMDKARGIHRDRLREARQPMLNQLDIEYQRAHERGDEEHIKTVAAAKQALRDVTKHPDIDAAQTPEELKAVWPFAVDSPSVSEKLDNPRVTQLSVPIRSSPSETDAGHTTGWIGNLVGKIAQEDIITMPTPIVAEEPEPEAPYHLPPQAPPPIPTDDTTRRRAAKAHIRTVAASFAFNLEAERLRYETALMAHNGAVQAIGEMAAEAQSMGLSVSDLAERIVNEHTVHARKMIRIKTLQDQALADLNNATGDDIATIEQRAVAEMTGDA